MVKEKSNLTNAGEAPAVNEYEDTTDESENTVEATLDTLRAECEEAIQKSEDNWNLLLRARAELENVRKRAERDVTDAHKYGLNKFVSALLPVRDGLDNAMEIVGKAENQQEAMREGLFMLSKMFDEVMAKFGVIQIDPKDQPFNPAHHEALSMQKVEDKTPGTVLFVVQKGYLLNERLVRPARVVVVQE